MSLTKVFKTPANIIDKTVTSLFNKLTNNELATKKTIEVKKAFIKPKAANIDNPLLEDD